jgi:hypothetical protein
MASGTLMRRGSRAPAVGLVLVLAGTACLGAGCDARSKGGTATPSVAPTAAAAVSSATGVPTPGATTVAPPAGQDGAPGVIVTGASVVVAPDGSAQLRMSVRALGTAVDHLVSVTTPDATGTTLVLDAAQRAAEAGQPANDDGVPLTPGTAVTFGVANGPRVLFRHPTRLAPGARVRLVLYFANVGLIHLTANVIRSSA